MLFVIRIHPDRCNQVIYEDRLFFTMEIFEDQLKNLNVHMAMIGAAVEKEK